MSRVAAERSTHQHEGDVVVFLIGMRVNSWWRVRDWWPTLLAMGPMLRELYADPSSGFLGARTALGSGGPMLVQYWASIDQLLAYAHDRDSAHRPAWQAFNARARRRSAAVGIWHETFAVPAGSHESMYVAMPVQGLAAATRHVPVGPRSDTAAQRLAGGAAV
jgi:hypothetical protein